MAIIRENKAELKRQLDTALKLIESLKTDNQLCSDMYTTLRDQFTAAEVEVGMLTKENDHYRRREHDERNEVKEMEVRMSRLQSDADEWLEAANNGLDARTAVRVMARELVKLEDEVGATIPGRYGP